MPAHYTAMAGDCNRISLLLRLDAQNGNRMRDALKEEMVEVCISIITCFSTVTYVSLVLQACCICPLRMIA